MDEDSLLKMVDKCVLQMKHNTQTTVCPTGNVSLINSTFNNSFAEKSNTNQQIESENILQQQRDSEIMEEDLFSD